jgi:hypothetical protein
MHLKHCRMEKQYFLYAFLVFLVSCSKKEDVVEQPIKTFTFTGTILDDETSLPVSGVWMYLLYGKMSCCSYPDTGAKLDSVKTDNNGKFAIIAKRLRDTSITYAYNYENVQFKTNNPFVTIASTEKGFPSRFDFANRLKIDTLKDDYKLNIDYRVMKSGSLNLYLKDIAPLGDSLFLDIKTDYPNNPLNSFPYSSFGYISPSLYTNRKYNLLVNKQTILTTTTKLNGLAKIRRDTFNNVKLGEIKELNIEF